jgi:hypothetical protein
MTDYRLLVDMLVPEDNTVDFEKGMLSFLGKGAFRFLSDKFDNELVFALKSVSLLSEEAASTYSSVENEPHALASNAPFLLAPSAPYWYRKRERRGSKLRHYVHLWTIPDLDDLDLATRMQFCSENKEYMAIDELVAMETQNFVRRVCWQEQPCAPNLDPAMRFIRAVRRLDYSHLGPYLMQLRCLVPALTQAGWQQLGQFQDVTGMLNKVTEFWQTENADHSKGVPAGDYLTRLDPRSLREGLRERAAKVTDYPVSAEFESFALAPYFGKPASFSARRDQFLKTRAKEPAQ